MNSLNALADPTRRQIVELLGRGEQTAGDIVGQFDLSAPAISQHLKVLREAGLVRVRVEGQRRIYCLDPTGLDEIERWVASVRRFWSERLDVLARTLGEAEDSGQEKRR